MADCIPKVALLATEDLSPFHFSVPCIVFGARIAEQKLFELMVCAEQAGRIQSREGFSSDVMHGLEAMEKADIIVVPFWACPSRSTSRELVAALQHSATGPRLVGPCRGTFLLDYAALPYGKAAPTTCDLA